MLGNKAFDLAWAFQVQMDDKSIRLQSYDELISLQLAIVSSQYVVVTFKYIW